MKRYFKYVKGNWFATIISPILMMLDVLGTMVQPFLMAKIIDVGIINGDFNYIIKIGLVMILFSILTMICGFLCMYFSAKAAYGFSYNLRADLISKIQMFSFANINKFKTSSLITRLTNDINILSNLYQMLLRIVVRAPLMFIGGLIMALFINKRLSLILVVMIPILFIFVVFLIKKVAPLFDKVQSSIDDVNSSIRENLKGIRVIKAFVRENYQRERFGNANNRLTDISINSYSKIIILSPFMLVFMNFSVASVLWFGGKIASLGGIEIGSLTSFISYIMMILSSLVMMSMVFMNFARASASSKRILEVLDEDIDIKNSSNGIKDINCNLISYNVNSFAYKDSSGEKVLKNIKFDVKKGDKVAIIGSTGSGKSTLINLLPRFFDVDDGEILIDNVNIKEYDLFALRDSIGMVLQENRLFSGTIKSNILWGNGNASMNDIIKACKVAQIDDFIQGLDDKYDSKVEQRGTNFSGGQKQRLCIARALLKKPKILVLDDSVSALDATTEANLTNALKKNFADTTTFIITQRISSCKSADYVIVMDNGCITDIGKHEDLLKSSTVYQEINNSQQEVLTNA